MTKYEKLYNLIKENDDLKNKPGYQDYLNYYESLKKDGNFTNETTPDGGWHFCNNKHFVEKLYEAIIKELFKIA